MSRTTRTHALTAFAVTGLVLLGTAAPASAQPMLLAKQYANCTALAKVYPHGVSKVSLTTKQWKARGATGKPAVRPGVYKANKASMDRDKDGIACER